MSTLTLPRSNLASSAGSTAPRAAAIGRTDSAAAAAEADLRRFGANRHQEVDDLRVGVGTVRPWADADVVADGALRLVGRIAAASGWRNVPDGRVVHELLRGVPLTTACLQRAAGAEGAELLHEAGFVIAIGERWRLAFAVALVDDVFVLAPHGVSIVALHDAAAVSLTDDVHHHALWAGADGATMSLARSDR